LEASSYKIIKLEKHDTRDIIDKHVNGSLTVIWRDWDEFLENPPKMVYITSTNKGERKGPHIHTKRTSYFICIQGKVVFIIKDQFGKYHEVILDENDPSMIIIPKNIASAHVSLHNEISKILTLADISWKPNDNEMTNVTFDDYDWKKWNN